MSIAAKAAAAPARAPLIRQDITVQARRLMDESADWVLVHWLQVTIAAVIGTVIVMALIGLRAFGRRLCATQRPGERAAAHWRTIFGQAIARTHLWFMLALAAKLVIASASPPAGLLTLVNGAFTIATALQAAIWAREIILGAVEHRAGEDLEHSAVGSAMGIIRLLVTFALFAVSGILILDNLGVNVTGLVAGLGIGGIAIGLAAQGIFADLFAALAIIFDRPFRRGDSIRWDQTSGSVEAIGLKSTRVRALTGEQIVIANKALLDKVLHNFARLDRRRVKFTLGVTYETPTDVMEGIPDLVRRIVEGTEKCSLVRCGLTTFNASSLDFEVQFDVHSETYDVVFGTASRVGIAIVKAFNEAGIAFAYPTQTSYLAAPDGTFVNPLPRAAD